MEGPADSRSPTARSPTPPPSVPPHESPAFPARTTSPAASTSNNRTPEMHDSTCSSIRDASVAVELSLRCRQHLQQRHAILAQDPRDLRPSLGDHLIHVTEQLLVGPAHRHANL